MRSISVTFFIAARDFKGLFQRPMLHMILAFSTLLMGVSYMRGLILFASRSHLVGGSSGAASLQMELFAQHLSMLHLLLVLFTPVLTMRLLAEEKKLKTYELLSSSPITSTQITLGKFTAGWAITMVVVALSFFYPAATSALTPINWGPLLSSYCGIVLVTTIYVAIGLFTSALSDSIMLSVVMAWILSLGVFFLGQSGYGSNDPFWTAFFEQISMGEHLYSFMQGVVKSKGFVFLLSAAGFFVYLTQRVVESERWR